MERVDNRTGMRMWRWVMTAKKPAHQRAVVALLLSIRDRNYIIGWRLGLQGFAGSVHICKALLIVTK